MNPQAAEPRAATLIAGAHALPLTAMTLQGTITGLLHHTTVQQTFVNDHDTPLEAIYTHPLPPKAAVHGFQLRVGDRVVLGQIQERQKARETYSQALQDGNRAALLEQERSDIFTTTVGNIAPGETVTISFELSGPLEFLESTASLRFPLVVPEVYISGRPLGGNDVGSGVAADTYSVPDASRLSPPRLPQGASNPVDLRLSFIVDPAGIELEEVTSLCHFAKTVRREDGRFEISLLPGLERLDRDFVVALRLKEDSLQTTLMHDPTTGTFALTVVPPLGAGKALPPRDLVVVLDRSGSMGGQSMVCARRAAARIVDSLTSQDRFSIVAFDHVCEVFSESLVPAEASWQERALAFLNKLEARGGTEARPALDRALQMIDRDTARDKTILFLTDGDVGNDAELVVASAQGVRVSTVGIGRNSRAGVLESMAKTSGGLCTMIPEEGALEEALRNLHQRLGRPHWMGLSLRDHQDPDPAPRFWDVWEGVPTTFFGKADQLPETVEIHGWVTSKGKTAQTVSVLTREDSVVSRSWARARLLDLDDLWTIGKVEPSELVRVSVDAQVLCRFTAMVAVDTSETVDNAENLRTVVQPVEPTLPSPASAQLQLGGAAPGAVRRRARFESDAEELFSVDGDDLFSDAETAYPEPAPPACPSPIPGSPLKKSAPRLPGLGDAITSVRRSFIAAGERLKPAAPKKEKGSSFWLEVLQKLESLDGLNATERQQRLSELITEVGERHRKLPSNATAHLDISRQVMSLLVDLQQCHQRGEEGEVVLSALKALLNGAASLP